MTTDAAVLIGGVLIVPPELLAALLHEMEAPKQRLPLDVAMPRRMPAIAELVVLIREGAIAHNKALRAGRESFATLSHPASVPPLDTSVVAGSLSAHGEVVGVAFVAEMLGKSKPWVRELARNGALPGAQKVRGVGNGRGTAHAHWCIPLASAHAYLADRQVAR
jgi:hypothetical protein